MFRVVVRWVIKGVIKNTKIKARKCSESCVWMSIWTWGCFIGRNKFKHGCYCLIDVTFFYLLCSRVNMRMSVGSVPLASVLGLLHVNNVWEIFVDLCFLHGFYSVCWCLRMLERLFIEVWPRFRRNSAIFPVYFPVFYTMQGLGVGQHVRSKSLVFPHQLSSKCYCKCFQVVCPGRPYERDSMW